MSSYVIKITSCPSEIGKLEHYVQQVSDRFNINQEKYPDILISLTEAVNNAIIHGNCNDKSKCVDIVSRYTEGIVVFSISDQGEGFDPSQVADPREAECIEQDGGRGVLIMKELCDKIHYKDNGSTVELAFNLDE